ncbi:MAG: OmpA family protein [Crocinitomicaceae bacterium]
MKLILLFLSFTCLFRLSAQFKADSLTFYFPYDSAEPIENSINTDRLVGIFKQDTVTIYAYADTVGTTTYNLKLAKRRAEAIQVLLTARDIPSVIFVEGETSQFGDVDSNRRVDLKFKLPVEGKLIKEVINLNIQFVGNQAVVLAKSYYLIDELIEKIKSNQYTKIELHGHVCCSPDLLLSQNRALAIRKKLIENGVDEAIIDCYGHSNFDPLVPEFSEADQEKNRRVEVVLIKSEIRY